MEVRIEGAEQLRLLARKLRDATKELRSDLYRGINRAVKPLKQDVRESALKILPKGGGLAKRVAKSKITTKRRVSGAGAGVRLVGRSGYDIGSINRGRVRHLTYGHEPWVNQAVPAGFWTQPLTAGGPKVAAEIQEVMDDITQKIIG